MSTRFLLQSLAKQGENFATGAVGDLKTAVKADIETVKEQVESAVNEVALDIKDDIKMDELPVGSRRTSAAADPALITGGDKKRHRKLDRKALHSDLVAELPISIRYGYNTVGDDDQPENYVGDWQSWNAGGKDRIDGLIQTIDESIAEFDKKSAFNVKCAKSIQFSLLFLGSSIVYVQASGADYRVISDWNIVGGALTTACTMVYNFFNFGKRGPHFARVVTNLRLLRGWIQSKVVLPVEHRFSPYDIFMISTKAYENILQEAEQGDKAATNSN